MRYDLLDMTFIVPVRIDSVVRLENLIMSVEFLVSHYQTHIHILEAARYSNQLIRRLLPDPSVEYCFQQDKDPVFHRTRWLNQMLLKVKTPLVCVWDADVLMNPIRYVPASLIWPIRMTGIFWILPISYGLTIGNIGTSLFWKGIEGK